MELTADLIDRLKAVNAMLADGDYSVVDAQLEQFLDRPSCRLASYGTLQPGESNHHIVEMISGHWTEGYMRGHESIELTYPVYTWDEQAPHTVPVLILNSKELPDHWDRIDEFEGDNYRRVLVPVHLKTGTVQVCYVYARRTPLV